MGFVVRLFTGSRSIPSEKSLSCRWRLNQFQHVSPKENLVELCLNSVCSQLLRTSVFLSGVSLHFGRSSWSQIFSCVTCPISIVLYAQCSTALESSHSECFIVVRALGCVFCCFACGLQVGFWHKLLWSMYQ